MSQGTAIEWAKDTWNPVTGCDRVSPGCDFCYAQTLAKRLKAMGNPRYQRDGDPRTSGPGFGVTLHHDKLDEPLRWRKPTVAFVNSMSDLFHDDVPDEFIAQVFAVMALAQRHTFQVLTKRPRRMARLVGSDQFLELVTSAAVGIEEDEWIMHDRVAEWPLGRWPLPNVWLGTSVEDQRRADLRIPHLLNTPAAVRFLSCEPLLGPVRLTPYIGHPRMNPDGRSWAAIDDAVPLDWVIVGGESGAHLWEDPLRALVTYDPDRRAWLPKPERIAWVESLRDECEDAGVPFFFKQWGGNTPKAGGRELDGRTWDQLPEATPARSRAALA